MDELIYLNGIDGATGGYLTDSSISVDALSEMAKRHTWGEEEWQGIESRHNEVTGAAFAPMPEYGDGSDLKLAGWGMIFPAGAESRQVDAILEAMDELVQHRKDKAGKRFKIYRGADGYRWVNGKGETKNDFLSRHGASVGPVDTNVIPYHLLILSDPQSIPFEFQYELDVQYSVGRIYFQTLAEYARYAHSVVLAETGQVSLKRRAVFFGVANPDDQATGLSAEHLVKPLADYAIDKSKELDLDWEVGLVEPKDADRETLKSLMGGSQTPALLFTASHGIGWSQPNPDQYKYQGGLVCQDWKGPRVEKVTRQHYLAAEDVPDNGSLLGLVAFHFACYGAGTPYWDAFAIARNQARQSIAVRPFLAALPMRLLSHPNGGALAVIGHIERAWGYSFAWGELKEQTQAFRSILYQLLMGLPVGVAMDPMNVRYAEIATMLSNSLNELKYDPKAVSPGALAFQWIANNDSRGYAVLGDPAVCLSVAPKGAGQFSRPSLQLTSTYQGVFPVVFAQEALDSLTESEKEAVRSENTQIQAGQAFEVVKGDQPKASRKSTSARRSKAKPAGGEAERGEQVSPRTQQVVEEQPAVVERPPQTSYSSPIDGLAFALQLYSTEGGVKFSTEAGVSYDLLDDAREQVKNVVSNLNAALQSLTMKMKEAANNAATLEVTTSVVDDLNQFEAKNPAQGQVDQRFKTTISLTGDVQLFVPRQAVEVDAVLLSLHKEMVEQAMQNRMEMIRALSEMVTNLFGGGK